MQNLKEKLEEIQLQYAYGDCAVFAIALSEIYDYPIVEFYDKNKMVHVALVVEGATLKDDIFLDVLGKNSYLDIKRRYGITGKCAIEPKTVSQLRRMTYFSQEDIDSAKECLNWLLTDTDFGNSILIDKKNDNKLM